MMTIDDGMERQLFLDWNRGVPCSTACHVSRWVRLTSIAGLRRRSECPQDDVVTDEIAYKSLTSNRHLRKRTSATTTQTSQKHRSRLNGRIKVEAIFSLKKCLWV